MITDEERYNFLQTPQSERVVRERTMTFEVAQELTRSGVPVRRRLWREWDQILMYGGSGEYFLDMYRSERRGYRPSVEDQEATDWEVAP